MLRIVRASPRLVIKRSIPSPFFHLHAHSRFSHRDALSDIDAMVAKAKAMGQGGLALTDHGNMAGVVQLYQACTKAGIAPFPGAEMYFVTDRLDKKAKRFHLGMVAYTSAGYAGLCQLSSYSHRRESFYHKPLIDWTDLAEFKERGWLNGVLITTGCYFGLVVQTLITAGELAARHTIYRLMQMTRTAVELQAHRIDQEPLSETEIAQALYDCAQAVGAPVVVTQDSHYVEATDQPVHESLKRLVAFGEDPDEAVFPGDGFHLCDHRWMADHHQPLHLAASDEFCKILLADHTLSIPELDRYSYKIPATVDNPLAELREMATTFIKARNLPTMYTERMNEELEVLDVTGMAGYLLLVKEFTDWLRAHDIFFQARGSAAGSMLCWIAGITPVDPIHYKLLFARFMSKDRMKPPDIDLDIEDHRRPEALDWLKGRFASAQIGTHAKFGIAEDGKGSLKVAYFAKLRNAGLEIKTYADLPEEIKAEMHALDAVTPYKSAGVNAAGIIVTDSREYLHRVVPMMGIPSGDDFSYVSQYPKDDIEALGIVKLDAMGLKNLAALRRAYVLVKQSGTDYGSDLQHIPLADDQVFAMLRRGETQGVFQLEGGTALRGCREIKPRSLKDIIVIMALYRPAVMERDRTTGLSPKDLYLARRQGRETVPERHDILRLALKETYGLFVFQEQVIHVLRELGFEPEDLTSFLKAVKASNSEIGSAGQVIAGYEGTLRKFAQAAGMSEGDVEFVWSGIAGYAAYGFNRSHATVYGLTAYRTAYFKFHHPLEYATALLQSWAGHPKETQVIDTVRAMHIPVRRAHVNVSGANYSLDRKARAVRRALVAIGGIGEKAAAEIAAHAPYESIADMITRCDARKVSGGKSYAAEGTLNGVLGKLSEAGALSGLDER